MSIVFCCGDFDYFNDFLLNKTAFKMLTELQQPARVWCCDGGCGMIPISSLGHVNKQRLYHNSLRPIDAYIRW